MGTNSKIALKLLMGTIGLMALVSGCANLSNTDVHSYYYSPQWSSGNEIICLKNRSVVSGGSGGFGGSSTNISNYYYISRLNPGSLNERDLIFIGSGLMNVGDLSLSPLGNYYAYKTYKKLNILRTDGTPALAIDLADDNVSFDWSPDESSMVLLENGSLHLVDKATGSISLISTIEAIEPAWSYAEKIVFYAKQTGGYNLSFIKADGTGLEITGFTREATGSNPQYSIDGTIIYAFTKDHIEKIDASTKTVVSIIATSNESIAHQISPDGTKLLGTDNDIFNYYIFTTELDGSSRNNILKW